MRKLLLFAVAMLLGAQLINAQDYHWPLTSDVKDVKGGLEGTNEGITFGSDDVRGPVAKFNGTGFARLPQFVKGNSAITIAIWWKMDVVAEWSRIYTFGMGDQTDPKDVMMVIPVTGAPSKFRFTLSPATSPGGPWLDADTDPEVLPIETSVWYYSVVTITGDSVIVFHNDREIIATGYARDISIMEDTENALGKSFWPDAPFTGSLSDLRIYKKALTRSEIVALYNETKLPKGPSAVANLNAKALNVCSHNKRIYILNSNISDNEIVSVYNITGSLVKMSPINAISSIEFKSGMYLLKVTGTATNFSTKILIK